MSRRLLAPAVLAMALLLGRATTAPGQDLTDTSIVSTTTTTAAPTTPSTTTVIDASMTTTVIDASTTTTIDATTTTTIDATTTSTTASTTTTTAPTATTGPLSISAPDAVDLTSAVTSTGLSAQLGAVTVTNEGSLLSRSWVASVTATDFTNGTGGTVPRSSISYWSGPATAATGVATPGQLTSLLAATLSSSVTAFMGTGLVTPTSVTWNPTIVMTFPAGATAGTYTGTITHSVA